MLNKSTKKRRANQLIHFTLASALLLFTAINAVSQQKREYIVLSHPYSKVVSDHVGRYPTVGNEVDSYEFVIDYADDFKDIKTNIKLVGMLGAGAEYRLSKLEIEANSISFQTETINDVRFDFEGVFLKKGNLTRFYRSATPVLKGVLTKYVGDKKDSSVKISCRYRALKAPYYLP